jgi:hypothetical protein
MHSSIFNSKHPAFLYAKVLIGICVACAVLLEILTSYSLKHHSETYSRVAQQYAEALKARPAKPGEPASVLMVGNSLLLYGVDVGRLQTLTSGRIRIYPIFLEATGYYDWLYGLQRLFREGARPQIVVLGVGMNYFFADSVRRDYAPMMFLDARDTLAVASDLKMDRTAATDLLLAHSSVFWDLRGVIRIQVLRHTIPHCRELFSLLTSQSAVPPPREFDASADARLMRLRELCESNGAKLIILVPPAPSSEDSVRRLTIASRKAGVDTLVPIDPATLSVRFYLPDEIHLNPDGAQLFTTALATYLPQQTVLRSMSDPN